MAMRSSWSMWSHGKQMQSHVNKNSVRGCERSRQPNLESSPNVAPAVLFEKCGTGLVLRSFKTAQLQLASRSKKRAAKSTGTILWSAVVGHHGSIDQNLWQMSYHDFFVQSLIVGSGAFHEKTLSVVAILGQSRVLEAHPGKTSPHFSLHIHHLSIRLGCLRPKKYQKRTHFPRGSSYSTAADWTWSALDDGGAASIATFWREAHAHVSFRVEGAL